MNGSFQREESAESAAATLRAAFAALGPAPPLRRAEAALWAVLSGVRASVWPEVAWRFSRLQPGGFPLEFTFSTAAEALWAAAEVGGPEMPEADRLARGALLLEALGAPLSDARLADLGTLQSSGPLRWGCWLGSRHGEEGDRYKLYVEAPTSPAAEAFAARCLGASLRDFGLGQRQASGLEVALRSVGADAAGRIELYFRAAGLAPEPIARLLARTGQGTREGELISLLDRIWEVPAERALAQGVWGISVGLSPTGAAESLSLYKPATYVLGRDRQLRRRLLALVPSGQLATYRHATAALGARGDDAPLCHRLLAILAVPERPLELRIGVDPSRLGLAPQARASALSPTATPSLQPASPLGH